MVWRCVVSALVAIRACNLSKVYRVYQNPVHALTGVVGIILMALGQAAILLRAQGRSGLLEPGGALMLLVYVSGLWLVFLRTQSG